MATNNKTKIKFILSLLFSLFIIAWLLTSIDWESVISSVKQLNYKYLLLSTFLIFIHFLIRTIRWKFLLNAHKDYDLRLGFDAIQLGNFVNYILPFRAGEIARPLFLTKKTKIPFPITMSSVVVERFFDLACVLGLFSLLVVLIPDLPTWANDGVFILGVLAIGILFGMFLASFYPKFLKKSAFAITKFLPELIRRKILKLLNLVIEGASLLKDFKNLVIVILLSAIIWLSNIALFYVWAFMLPVDAPFFELALACSVLIALAVAAPSAPGFIGVYQVGCIAAFTIFGISKELAVAFSIVTHLFQYIIFIAYGVYLTFKYGLKVKDYS